MWWVDRVERQVDQVERWVDWVERRVDQLERWVDQVDRPVDPSASGLCMPGAGPPRGAGPVAEKIKDSLKRSSQMLNLLE